MDKENVIEEQPFAEQAEVSNETIRESADSREGSSKEDAEIELGKFKSSKALLEAYNNLHAEFTKKCQRLSELEKEKTIEQSPEKIDARLDMFLSKNSEASKYRDEFKSYLQAKKEGNGSMDGAWAKFVLSKLASREEGYTEEPIVQKYIFQDENVRNKIIENYIKELNHHKTPILMNSQSGQRVAEQKPATPVTLSDAKKLVEEMFS